MTTLEIFSLIISISGIFAITWAAIYSIRKTAEETRVSDVHKEMCMCLVNTIGILREVINLIEDVTHNVIYQDYPEKQGGGEKAYDRYWKRIGELSNQFVILLPKQRLFLPRVLYDEVSIIVEKLNECRNLIRHFDPENRVQFQSSTELLEEVGKNYREFIDQARAYIGTDKLCKIIDWDTEERSNRKSPDKIQS